MTRVRVYKMSSALTGGSVINRKSGRLLAARSSWKPSLSADLVSCTALPRLAMPGLLTNSELLQRARSRFSALEFDVRYQRQQRDSRHRSERGCPVNGIVQTFSQTRIRSAGADRHHQPQEYDREPVRTVRRLGQLRWIEHGKALAFRIALELLGHLRLILFVADL